MASFLTPAWPRWQDQLRDYCQRHNADNPVFTIVSDRRGRRTAWSSAVVVGGITYQARYFYHGDFIDNAREDAAEVALRALSAQQSAPVPSLPTLHATQPMPQYGRIQG